MFGAGHPCTASRRTWLSFSAKKAPEIALPGSYLIVESACSRLSPEPDRAQRRQAVGGFLADARGGDFSTLLALPDADVVLRADAAAVEASPALVSAGAPALVPEVHVALASR